MAHSMKAEDVDTAELQMQLELLRQENEKLRMANEITTLEKQLLQMSMQHTSTPNVSHRRDPAVEDVATEPSQGDRAAATATPYIKPRTLQFEDGPSSSPMFNLQDEHVTTRRNKASKERKSIIKPATYDGTNSWVDYKAHFDTCAEINDWSYEEKGLFLAVQLRGQAQGVFGNLCEKSKDFKSLVKALEDRFAPPHQTELYRVQLRERRQKATESLPELGQDIRRLANLAYPTAPQDVKETLAKEQFVDALVSVDMRLRIKQARPTNLNDAVRHAVELEAFNRAEKRTAEAQGIIRSASSDTTAAHSNNKELNDIKTTIQRLEQQMNTIMANKDSYRQNSYNPETKRKCYECGSEKHLRRHCPRLQKKIPDTNKADTNDKGINTSSFDGAGLYIPVKFDGQVLNCLVDTGATVTLMSSKVWNDSSLNRKSELCQYNRNILSAAGTPLNIKGKTSVEFEMKDLHCSTDVVIAEIENDLIMGLDFMLQHDGVIDIAKMKLAIQGKQFDLNCTGQIGWYRITVAETIEVPGRSEMIVRGYVSKVEADGKTLYKANCGKASSVQVMHCDRLHKGKPQLLVGVKTFGCDQCAVTFKKKAYLRQHVKRKHGSSENMALSCKIPAETNENPADSDDSSDREWDKEPQVELCESQETSECTVGRMFRKQTSPMPVSAPVKTRSVVPEKDQCRAAVAKARKLVANSLSVKETQTDQMATCQFCKIWFQDKAMYALHNTLHSASEPFRCLKCDQELKNRLEFMAHQIWHLGPNME